MVSRKALKTPQKGLGGPGNLCVYLAGEDALPFHFVTESTQRQSLQAAGPGFWRKHWAAGTSLPTSPPRKSSRGFPFHFLPG